MATSTAPSMPVPHASLQRSFTLPPKLSAVSTSPLTSKSPESDAVETLFIHHRGKIVSFSTSSGSERSCSASLGDTSTQYDVVGALPWRSHTERTLAAGLIRVYRVPGSVAFLNSGKTVHAILPKSQCWCVDGETKFVLRIRSNNYYRIELPNEGLEDTRVAEEFKTVLAKISQYETTPCPFKRGFYVELPESPETPKRPWRPKHLPTSPSPVVLPKTTQEKDNSRYSALLSESKGDPSNPGGDFTAVKSGTTPPVDEDEPLTARKLISESEPRNIEHLVSVFESRRSTKDTIEASPRSDCKLDSSGLAPSSTEDGNLPLETRTSQTEDLVGDPSCSPLKQGGSELHNAAQDLDHTDSDKLSPSLDSQTQVDNELNEPPKSISEAQSIPSDRPLEMSSRDNKPCEVDITGFRWLEDPDEIMTPTASGPIIQTRSVTAPSDLSKNREMTLQASQPNSDDPDAISIASSIESFESFHSFHSPTSPLPPSPPYSQSPSPPLRQLPIDIQRIRPHRRDGSELTITAEKDCSPVDMSTPNWPGDSPVTPMPDDFPQDLQRDPPPTVEPPPSTSARPTRPRSPSTSLTRNLIRRRAHSPLPAPANIYIPQSRLSGGYLTSIILQKTYNLLLGPPVQLVALMLNVAAKIAAGSLTARTFTYNESGQPIPCSWGEDEDEGDSEAEQDDYGISLGGTPEARGSNGARHRQKSWDID